MKTIYTLAILLGISLFFTSCGSDDEPYIVFRDSNGNAINAPVITVPLNSERDLYIDIGYEEAKGEHNMIHYERQINDGQVIDLTFTGTLDILTVGVHNNLLIEKAKIYLDFNENRVSRGSHVTVIIRDNGSLRRTLVFEVE